MPISKEMSETMALLPHSLPIKTGKRLWTSNMRPLPESVLIEWAWWTLFFDTVGARYGYGITTSVLESFDRYLDKQQEAKQKGFYTPELEAQLVEKVFDSLTESEIEKLGHKGTILDMLARGPVQPAKWLREQK